MSGTIDLAWIQSQFPNLTTFTTLPAGGQKIVVGAEHGVHGPVVLKLFKEFGDLKRIQREIAAAQQLQGCRVPRVFESGVQAHSLGDVPWLIEARLDGVTLRDVIRRGPLSAMEVIRLGLQLLETLAVAEQLRIVHRDVKPDNIMVDSANDYWLIDFGFSRHLDLSALTAIGMPFGPCTPGYAPPEQFRNRQLEIDGRADLFAVAVTLYESFAQVNPFSVGASSIGEVLRRVENSDLPDLVVPAKAASDLRDLVRCMSRRRRDQRPRTVQEALDWMRDIATQEGVV